MVESCLTPANLNQIFVMTKDGIVITDESVCLEAPDRDTVNEKPKVKIMACNGSQKQKWRHDAQVNLLFLS